MLRFRALTSDGCICEVGVAAGEARSVSPHQLVELVRLLVLAPLVLQLVLVTVPARLRCWPSHEDRYPLQKRTPAQASSARVFTASIWLKRSSSQASVLIAFLSELIWSDPSAMVAIVFIMLQPMTRSCCPMYGWSWSPLLQTLLDFLPSGHPGIISSSSCSGSSR